MKKGIDVYIHNDVEFKIKPTLGSHIAIDKGVYCTVNSIIGNYTHISPYVTIIGGKLGKFKCEGFNNIMAGARIICGSDRFDESGLFGALIPSELKGKQIIEPVIQPETHKAENRIIREVIEETPEEKVEEVKPVDLNELRFPTKEMMSESEDTNVSQLAEAMNRFNKKDEIITEEISDLEQLKREFKNFKDTVIKQMSTIGGGGEVNLLKLDDIDTGAIGDGKVLSYNSGTGKLQFVTGGAGALADLTDVDDTDLANDSIMQYNSTSGKFEFTNELDGGTV